MRRFAAVLAVLLVLAGCASALSPRLNGRPPIVTSDLYPRLVTECIRRVPGMAGIELRVIRPMPADVHIWVADAGRVVPPERLDAIEIGLEECLERYPLDLNPVDYRRTAGNDLVMYQYYVGPLTACLAEHGIFLDAPPSLGEFRHRDFARNPYTELRWSVERLARVHQDCPPIPFMLKW